MKRYHQRKANVRASYHARLAAQREMKKHVDEYHNEQTEVIELTEDQRLQETVDAINYTNLCARATLGDVPLLTIEDLKKK